MKELGIEEKAKRYDEALERAKYALTTDMDNSGHWAVNYIFPELKESGDESIRKAIISGMIALKNNQNIKTFAAIPIDDCIAWLERQGEQTHAELGQSEVTKTSGQKLEPKFHPGDWIIDKIGNIYQIEKAFKSVVKDIFGYTIVGGGYFNDNSNVRLWTINDAKDGDVLAVNSMPFIYNGCKDEVAVGAYCGFNAKHIFSFAYNYAINQNITPATKEQCDRLFAKMKEVGYKWDSEKKDFKRI